MWFSRQMGKHSHHPHQGAPLCTPCGYSKDTSGLPFPLPPGCPCRVEELCRADTTGVLNKPPKACGVPRYASALLAVNLLLLHAIPARRGKERPAGKLQVKAA